MNQATTPAPQAPATLPYTTLGKTGLRVSRLGFGAAEIGYLGSDQPTVDRLVARTLDLGVNLFDSAAVYPHSEQLLGRALCKRRDDAILITKVGPAQEGLPGDAWTPELIFASVDRSLQRLHLNHLDIVLLHSCDIDILKRGEAFGALLRLQKQGKLQHIGYSGDNAEAAHAAGLPEVEVIETSVNICDQSNIDHVLPIAEENNIGVIAKRPIANAVWKQSYEHKGIYREYTAAYAERFRKMNVQPPQLGYDDHVEITWPQIALRFTLSIPGVHTAIVGTTSPDNASANVTTVRQGELCEEAVRRLRDAFHKAQTHTGQMWEGLT